MNNDNMIFIGMDTHKVFCENAYCGDSRESTPQSLGRIPTTKQAITKLARQLQSKYPKATLHFVYEARLFMNSSFAKHQRCEKLIYELRLRIGTASYPEWLDRSVS